MAPTPRARYWGRPVLDSERRLSPLPSRFCRLRCALTELDLISCARNRTFVLICTAELVVPLGKARAIARALISWVNSNFIFSFPDGSSHQTRRCAPLPSRRTRRPLHLRLHRHPLSAATIATIANAVSAPPSSPSLSSSLPHHRHPHRPPRRRHLLAARPMLPPGKVPLPPSPSPPPPSPTPLPPVHHPLRVAALTIGIATVSFALSLTTATLTTTLAAITISSRPVMRNGCNARACPRHMCVHPPARPPSVCTAPPLHFLALTLHNTLPLLPRFLADLIKISM